MKKRVLSFSLSVLLVVSIIFIQPVVQSNAVTTLYYTKTGTVWHKTKSCSSLSRSKTILECPSNNIPSQLKRGCIICYGQNPPTRSSINSTSSSTSSNETLKISKKSVTLKINKKITLKVTGGKQGDKVTWSSKNKKIASVTNNGKVTAKKKGKTTIVAKKSGKKITCKVTVIS